MPWNPGDHIVLRWTGPRDWVDESDERNRTGAFHEKPGIVQAWPHIVVADQDDLLVLWMPAGTRTESRDLSNPGRGILGRDGDNGGWRKDSLRVMFPGKRYSVSFDWSPNPERDFGTNAPREL